MEIVLTEQDVEDALFAYHVDDDTEQGIKCRIEEALSHEISRYNFDTPDEYMNYFQASEDEALERYQRGKELLTRYYLHSSSRGMVMGYPAEHTLGDRLYEEFIQGRLLASPVILVPAGYRAQTEVFRYVALFHRTSVQEG